MSIFRLTTVSLTFFWLVGCATVTPDIAVNQNFWKDKKQVIAVAVADVPKPTTHKAGAQGLLDIAINDAMADELDIHLGTIDTSEINKLVDEIVGYLSQKGYDAKGISNVINVSEISDFENESTGKGHYAEKDFRVLKEKHGADKLVLISAVRLGTIRSYYGFIPTSSPTGLSHLNGQIINLGTNELEWNQKVEQRVPFEGEEWDTPPDYPSLSKAVTTALLQSKKVLFNHLAQ